MDNTLGIKKAILNQLEDLKNDKVEKYQVASERIINTICDVTEKTGREIAVYIDRRGEVIDIGIGDEDTVALKNHDRRRSEESLSGIRCIHTHPNGVGMLSDIDLSALKKLRFDLMVSVGVQEGSMTNAYLSFLGVDENKQIQPIVTGPYSFERLLKVDILQLIEETESNIKVVKKTSKTVEDDIERAILVGVENEEALEELRELLKTAGGVELSRIVQSRDKKDIAHFIGKGKLKELQLLVQAMEANLVVFDEELTGAQTRNLEEALGVKVIDRTQLILDIFAQRAKSREGKLQVELAQLKYLMPRLIGLGAQMSRTGAGIGTRGPGEKKLEIDRRRIRDRINDLNNEIKEIKKQRDLQRVSRESGNIFQACLVGYTNAGKSTLLNTLANADIYAKDQLFATLDPTTRKVIMPSGRDILVTDTVGFIRKLPHDLVEAFKSTLEEVLYADLLIHVVDGSNPGYENQIKVVLEVLTELGAEDRPIITVVNKIDKISNYRDIVDHTSNSATIHISAANGLGLDELLGRIEQLAAQKSKTAEVLIPYTDAAIASMVHNQSKVLVEDYREDGIYIKAEFDKITYGRVAEYIL